MEVVLKVLHAVSPLAPIVFLFVMANGMLAPVIYMLRHKLPYNICIVRAHAREGRPNARYVYYSWLAFAVVAGAIVLVLLASLVLR
jgi:hypothetical protein